MKWEYRIVILSGEEENETIVLNRLGEEGWELVGVAGSGVDGFS